MICQRKADGTGAQEHVFQEDEIRRRSEELKTRREGTLRGMGKRRK
jgi:hypothetical protein